MEAHNLKHKETKTLKFAEIAYLKLMQPTCQVNVPTKFLLPSGNLIVTHYLRFSNTTNARMHVKIKIVGDKIKYSNNCSISLCLIRVLNIDLFLKILHSN